MTIESDFSKADIVMDNIDGVLEYLDQYMYYKIRNKHIMTNKIEEISDA